MVLLVSGYIFFYQKQVPVQLLHSKPSIAGTGRGAQTCKTCQHQYKETFFHYVVTLRIVIFGAHTCNTALYRKTHTVEVSR